MISLDKIEVFARTVELGSLAAAGRRVGISSAVASYRIGALEQEVGYRLLNRTTRQVIPTDSGREFYRHCLHILDAVQDAQICLDSIGKNPQGTITITAPLNFGRRFVAPTIARFGSLYPKLEVKLKLSDQIMSLTSEGIDLAVRMTNFDDSALKLRKIMTVKRGLFASPSYVRNHGMPKTPDQLTRHRCLVLRFPGSTQTRWPFTIDDREKSVEVSAPLHSDDGDVLTDWALAGEGIVLKPVFEVAEHLRSSQLVPVLSSFLPGPVTLGLLYTKQKMTPFWIRSLIDLIAVEGKKFIASAARESSAHSVDEVSRP